MSNIEIFKVELLSITPSIKVLVDKNMKDNIANADTEVVANLIVKKTFWNEGFREVITNKLIPVFYETTEETRHTYNILVKEAPKSPVFFKIKRERDINGTIVRDNLQKARVEDLKMYAFDHVDRENFEKKLNDIFSRAQEYYNASKAQNNVTEETEIKRWLKTIKRCNKI